MKVTCKAADIHYGGDIGGKLEKFQQFKMEKVKN